MPWKMRAAISHGAEVASAQAAEATAADDGARPPTQNGFKVPMTR